MSCGLIRACILVDVNAKNVDVGAGNVGGGMRIVMIGVQLASLVKFRAPLIRALIAQGHQVVACAPEPSDYWENLLKETGATYVPMPMSRNGINPLRDLRLFMWLVGMLRQQKPDILFCFQAKAVIYGLPAGWLEGVKNRIAMIEGLGQGFIPGTGLKRRIVRLVVPSLYFIALRFARRVIFLNQNDVGDFKRRYLVRDKQIRLVPGIGIDLEKFSQQPLPVAQPLTFLMIARLIIDKGVREYLAAAQIVKSKHPEVRFQLIGEPDYSHVGVPVNDVQASGVVDYIGEVRDVRPYLAGCHVFVLPSYREGMPVAAMEALATGRAIVTTTAPGAREMVVPGQNGDLVPPCDIKALAQALLKMVDSAETLADKGAASRNLAVSRFEVGKINQQIISILMSEA